jgi:hypothetical protein
MVCKVTNEEWLHLGTSRCYHITSLGGGGDWRGWGWVRDRKGGKVTSYDWLGGGRGAVSWHMHTQGAVHFSLHNEHTSWIMARIYSWVQLTINCTREYS